MTDVLIVAAGVCVVGLTIADVVWTVLWSGRGAGPLSGVITGVMRRIAWVGSQRGGRRVLSLAGPLTLLLIVFVWAGLLVFGFALLLEIDPDGIRSSITDEPASLSERAYFVGYTVFTLGNGGFAPATDWLRALTILMNAVGMFLVTLSVTYLLPVISSSVTSRAFASKTLALGSTPEELLVGAWDGRRIDLASELRSLSSELATLAHQHLAYPIVHLFHSSDPTASAPLAVAVLDDALLLLEVVDPAAAPPLPVRRQLRSSIDRYLTTFGTPITRGGPVAPVPSLESLRAAGIPLRCQGEQFTELAGRRHAHRSMVRSLVDAAGVSSPTSPFPEH